MAPPLTQNGGGQHIFWLFLSSVFFLIHNPFIHDYFHFFHRRQGQTSPFLSRYDSGRAEPFSKPELLNTKVYPSTRLYCLLLIQKYRLILLIAFARAQSCWGLPHPLPPRYVFFRTYFLATLPNKVAKIWRENRVLV